MRVYVCEVKKIIKDKNGQIIIFFIFFYYFCFFDFDCEKTNNYRIFFMGFCLKTVRVEADWWCTACCGRDNFVSKHLLYNRRGVIGITQALTGNLFVEDNYMKVGLLNCIRPVDRYNVLYTLAVFIVCVVSCIYVFTLFEDSFACHHHIEHTSEKKETEEDRCRPLQYPLPQSEGIPRTERLRKRHYFLIIGTPGSGVGVFVEWAKRQPSLPYDRFIFAHSEASDIVCRKTAREWVENIHSVLGLEKKKEEKEEEDFVIKLLIITREPVDRIAQQWHQTNGVVKVKQALHAIDASMINIKKCDTHLQSHSQGKNATASLDSNTIEPVDNFDCYTFLACEQPQNKNKTDLKHKHSYSSIQRKNHDGDGDDYKLDRQYFSDVRDFSITEHVLLPLGMYDIIAQVWINEGWPAHLIRAFPVERIERNANELEKELSEFLGSTMVYNGAKYNHFHLDHIHSGGNRVSSSYWIPPNTRTKLRRYYAYHNANLALVLYNGHQKPLYDAFGDLV